MNKRSFNLQPNSKVILYHESLVDDIIHTSYIDENGNRVFCLSNDVTLLFNQERLDSLGADTLRKFIDQMNTYPKTSELLKNISDDDLFKFIKSRNYQSLGELKSWSHYLMANFDTELQEFQKRHDEYRNSEIERLEKERTESIKKFLDEHPEYRSVK